MQKSSTMPPAPPSTASVPMLDLKRQYATIRKEIQEAVDSVCESQQLVLGEEVAAFERESAQFLGAAETVACASGTDALWLAMQAAGVGPGDSVITTPFSFFATASSILRCGARPVFVDIDPMTLNIDPDAVARRFKERPPENAKAILPVHLYGQCADMDALNAIAREFGLLIIEDAAQAFGASWRGVRAGALGRAAAFSFYPTKNLSAFGDAGAVTTSNAELAARARSLRNHGSRQRYLHEEIGWNARMDGMQGAVLRVKLRHIEQWNNARREIAALYDKLFINAGLSAARGDFGNDLPVKILATDSRAHHIFHQYVIRVPKRDELRTFLQQRGIGSEVYYPIALHMQPCFEYLGYRESDLPETAAATRDVLALPIFPELTAEEVRRVVDGIAEFYS